MSETNKTLEVLKYLRKNGSITSMQAIEKFGATRLSAIIFNLRRNYIIDTLWMESVDRYGNACRYGKYVFKGEKDNGETDISGEI